MSLGFGTREKRGPLNTDPDRALDLQRRGPEASYGPLPREPNTPSLRNKPFFFGPQYYDLKYIPELRGIGFSRYKRPS